MSIIVRNSIFWSCTMTYSNACIIIWLYSTHKDGQLRRLRFPYFTSSFVNSLNLFWKFHRWPLASFLYWVNTYHLLILQCFLVAFASISTQGDQINTVAVAIHNDSVYGHFPQFTVAFYRKCKVECICYRFE